MSAAQRSVEAIEAEIPIDPGRYTTLLRLAGSEDHRLVLSFGGGSLAGLCGNLALVRIFEKLDLRGRVEEIWGTSAGAVVGGGWATGTPAHRVLGLVESLAGRGSVDFSLSRFALSILLAVRPFRRPLPDGLLRGRRFLKTIEAGLSVSTFEDCEIPFRCIACRDDGNATRKVFRRGKLLPAIFASMSLPGIVIPQPADDEGDYYYDGGLLEKSPLISPIADHGRSGDRRKLLLVCTHFAGLTAGRARGFVKRFLTALDIMEDVCWTYQLEEARSRKNVVLLTLNPRIEDAPMFDFKLTREVYARSLAAFADLLQDARIAQTFGMR